MENKMQTYVQNMYDSKMCQSDSWNNIFLTNLQ